MISNMLKILVLVLLATMIIIPAYTVFALDPLNKTTIKNSGLVSLFGAPIGTSINVNKQVQITSDVQNNQDENQKFIYIVQVKDPDERIISITWVAGNLNPSQILSPSVSWKSEFAGEYVIEIFVWDSFKTQLPLADLETFVINVS